MALSKQYDKRGLHTQFGEYKLVVDANSDLLIDDCLLEEQILHRMMMFECYLRERDMWEKTNDQIRYDQALDQANLLVRIGDVIKQMLDKDYSALGTYQSLQR